MVTSFFQIDNFPNLDNPKYLDGGLFDNLKTTQYIKDCIEAFQAKFPEQTPFFISKKSLEEILIPKTIFSELVKEEMKQRELYAFAFCYCLDDSRKTLSSAYLRLRLIYAMPKEYNAEVMLSDKIEANVYTNPIGKISKFLSLSDNFEWLTNVGKIIDVDRDTEKWVDIHSIKFPYSPQLNIHQTRIYEGNIISKKRLNDIYEEEIIKNKKSGIVLNFGYDKQFNKIFLVFSIESIELENFVTLSNNIEPLKCPPEEISVCKPDNHNI